MSFRYRVISDHGRPFLFKADELVPCIDKTSFTDSFIHPELVVGEFRKIYKPLPVIDPWKKLLGNKLDFELGHLIGMVCLRTSPNYHFHSALMLYVRGHDLFDYFIRTMQSRFDDFEYRHSTFMAESSLADKENTSVIVFSSEKFIGLMDYLKVEPRKKVCPRYIDHLPNEFREGMFLGMFDSNGYFEFSKDKEFRHIRCLMVDRKQSFNKSLFKFTDYIDIDCRFENYNAGKRVTISSGDILRKLALFNKSESQRTKDFIQAIRGEKIVRKFDQVPVSREIISAYSLWLEHRGRGRVPRSIAIRAISNHPNAASTQNQRNWVSLVTEPNTRLERYRKVTKV